MRKDGPAGFFSKVVRLVLPGSTARSNLGTAPSAIEAESETDSDTTKGRQLLRELMERRRRHDLVRQREFDQLRRMRRLAASSQPGAEGAQQENESQATGFLDTAPDHNSEERAVTLRKINEIEEQMSRQWWKTRPSEPAEALAPVAAAGPAPAAAGAAPRPPDSQASRHQPLTAGAAFSFGSRFTPPPTNFAATTPYEGGNAAGSPKAPSPPAIAVAALPAAPAPVPVPAPLPAVVAQVMVPDLELPDLELPDAELPAIALADLAPGDGPIAQLVATGPGPLPGPQPALPGFVHDPAIEEAAIEFANGHAAAAETSLRGLLDEAAEAGLDEAVQRERWFALFDLYRATGRREPFEAAAIGYAERFGQSPPPWFSLAAEAVPLPDGAGDFYWRSPALVGAHSVVRLRSGAAAAPGAWWLDWSAVEGFEYDAVALLLETFSAWSRSPAQIYFEGVGRLLATLEARTLTGAADAEADWWKLRMETLRLMGRMDDYEEAALDYCITYEVSPPSWQEPSCEFHTLKIGRPALPGDAPMPVGWESVPQAPVAESAMLAGEIGADIDTELARLDAVFALQAQSAMPGRDELLAIDCSRLIRMDFIAVGSVLGWAASHHGAGMAVEFRNLHRLVGAFFNLTGINEYARVYLRPD
ncbi:hypothetical protein GT347_18190 [Xylophilus rhododendri]|uniref:STAS domain-containing protein n=1 Tax=Xylophilus rhododendri TaxID=2697032 RepID=A0A857J7P9_9BURK|nr:STAS domain-containing protein [Xylophilus rhododendri]QHI99737.1 hypothetical protein GT347_18190 [Xylophilus rhododendri]